MMASAWVRVRFSKEIEEEKVRFRVVFCSNIAQFLTILRIPLQFRIIHVPDPVWSDAVVIPREYGSLNSNIATKLYDQPRFQNASKNLTHNYKKHMKGKNVIIYLVPPSLSQSVSKQ